MSTHEDRYEAWRAAATARDAARQTYDQAAAAATAAAKASRRASLNPDDDTYQAAWDAYDAANLTRGHARQDWLTACAAERDAWNAVIAARRTAEREAGR